MSASTEPHTPTTDKIKGETIQVSRYVLSEAERALLMELEEQAQQAITAAVAPFNAQSQGALKLIYRQQGLSGNCRLTDDKTALVREG